MVTIEYRCADGTPFPVTFRDADDAMRRWRCEREHGPDPQTPMAAALVHLGLPGAERAHSEVGLVLPPAFRPGPEASGFAYYAEDAMSDELMTALVTGCARLLERHGSALRIWHDHCLPMVKECCDRLDAAGDGVSLETLAELQHYGQQLTMIPAFVCGNDLDLLTATCRDVVGEEAAALVASELTQGYPNETLRADDDLWHLGRSAAASPAVGAALLADDPAAAMAALRATGAEPAFFAALDAFLDEWGGRCESWDIACPTWREQRGGFWSQLRQMAADDAPAPRLALERGAKRREALAAEIDGRLADDPATQARFRRRLARVADYVAVREERARWQLVLAGSLRSALLRRGRGLAERGLVDEAEDILFLVPAEVEAEEPVDLRSVVAARRMAHERWRAVAPPEVIGGPDPALDGAPSTDSGRGVTGLGVSRGVVTGTARVILDLADAHRLEPGDVLVCVMTTPAWTPLFGLASAIVADTGGMGSHPAIASREYGIPCVLGTGGATATIPDGALVTVDGEAGTVEVAVPAGQALTT